MRATLESSDTLIKQVGGNLDNMTSDMQSAKIAAEELKTALGELFAPTLAVMASNAADAIREVYSPLSIKTLKHNYRLNLSARLDY